MNFSDPLGLLADCSTEGKPCASGFVNFIAGFGDAASFGLSAFVRQHTPGGDPVNYGSGTYALGSATGAGASALATDGASTEESTGRVMIGETMERVRAKASEMGAEVFETSANTAKDMWRENSTWLRKAMREGKAILDYGLDEERAVRSKFYQAERALLQSRGYPTSVIQ